MSFYRKKEKIQQELDAIKRAEQEATKKVEEQSERLDSVIARNGFHLVLHKAVTGGKHKHAG